MEVTAQRCQRESKIQMVVNIDIVDHDGLDLRTKPVTQQAMAQLPAVQVLFIHRKARTSYRHILPANRTQALTTQLYLLLLCTLAIEVEEEDLLLRQIRSQS